MIRQKISLAALLLITALQAFSLPGTTQLPRIDGSIRIELDHPDGRYAAGDSVTVTATPVGDYPSTVEMTVYENGIRGVTTELGAIGERRVVYAAVCEGPVAVMLEFRPSGTTPEKTSFNPDEADDAFRIGYVVDGEGFETGFKAPAGLKRYWKRQVRRLRRVPMTVKAVPVELPEDEGIECFSVEISSIDSIPVRGYLARPVNAAPGSLPIVLNLHSAGVSGLWCRAKVKDAVALARRGAVVLDFNAHGMLNDAPEDYYLALENGRLKNYAGRPMSSRREYYFRTMILRAVRALDYMAEDPAWDGERVMLIGTSQGGAQSTALASIDPRVTDVVVSVPAMVGNGGSLLGRNNAWPWPLEVSGVTTPTSPLMDPSEFAPTSKNARRALRYAPYFDCALLLKGCNARFFVEIGLIDTTCPPSEVFSGVNGIAGPVTVVTCPYRNHWQARIPAQYMPWWEENVEKLRQEYISSHLGAKN